VRAVVRWSGETRLRVRLVPGPRLEGGGPTVNDSAQGVTRTFSYLVPRVSDRVVTVTLENIGPLPLHISEFRFGLF